MSTELALLRLWQYFSTLFKIDRVISVEAIEHSDNVLFHLRNIENLLKTNEAFILTTPNQKASSPTGVGLWPADHVKEYSAVELRKLLICYFN